MTDLNQLPTTEDMLREAMTPLDVIRFAAAHGYSYETATYAVSVLEEDLRAESGYWVDRGPRALLEASEAESVAAPRETYVRKF